MTTIRPSFRLPGVLRRAGGVLTAILFAASLRGQQQIVTVIPSGLNEPNYITRDPNNEIYFTDASDNRIVVLYPFTNGVFTLAGSSTAQSGYSNSIFGDQALFSQPLGIVYDSFRGGLVVVDQGNQVLRLVATQSGAVSTLAGTPGVYGANDGPASSAQFSYPVGIASDGVGNLYVADAGNNVIRRINSANVVNTVQVTNYTFYQPAALALDTNNNLWVADTRANTICVISNISVISNQSVFVIAGSHRVPGTNDAQSAPSALFNHPSGLLWDTNVAGLFISDTGNNTLRLLYPNTLQGGWSVKTVAGIPQVAGKTDGLLSVAQFSAPVGLVVDVVNNGYDIVDRGNNELRRYQLGPPLPAVPDPEIGMVTFPPNPAGPVSSVFVPLPSGGVFNSNNIIAIFNHDNDPNIKTYYILTNASVNQFFNPPVPDTNSPSAPNYPGDGTPDTANWISLFPPQASESTLYAISLAKGRAPSHVVSANFTYIAATPVITGLNGASVPLSELTSPATLWYTLNGTDPVPNGPGNFGPVTAPTNISFEVENNVTFKVQAFATGFANSAVATQVFYPSNYVANQISFGFASGEASSQFVGAPGHPYYVPVTLSPLPGASMYALQFNITLANLPGAPVPGQNYTFQSMLLRKFQDGTFGPLPPAGWNGVSLQSLLFTNTATDLLGVGWLEITADPRATNLYDPKLQDLISYSAAHETLFLKSTGQVVLGGYSFTIPANAPTNSKYQVQIGRPSADGDGFTQNVLIQAPTNGSLGAGAVNSIKQITVGVVPYLVGDVAPFRWFNAGDFGDGIILNNDVLEIFRCSAYNDNIPPVGSDFFDALDSSDGLDNNAYNGDDSLINSRQYGDGHLDVTDLYITFRRSLDPSLHWYERFWSNNGVGGVRLFAQTVSNIFRPSVVNTPAVRMHPLNAAPSGPRFITAGADTVQAGPGQTVQVPVRVLAADSLPVRVLMLNVDIIPLDGSPSVTTAVAFTPAAGLGTPTMTLSFSSNNYAATWLNSSNAGVAGTGVIGTVVVTLPTNAAANSSYLVHFEHFSASPNGLALFHSTIQDGLITIGDRTGSSWGDGIPDTWRLIYFGTVSNLLSAANLDPDGDGASNWQEYVAGTNPLDPASVLQLTPATSSSGFSLQWPSVPGKTYLVQSSTSLFSTNWTTAASNLPGTGQMIQLTDTNLPAPPARFYRVQVQ